jgi:hypothetical protein
MNEKFMCIYKCLRKSIRVWGHAFILLVDSSQYTFALYLKLSIWYTQLVRRVDDWTPWTQGSLTPYHSSFKTTIIVYSYILNIQNHYRSLLLGKGLPELWLRPPISDRLPKERRYDVWFLLKANCIHRFWRPQ